MPSKDTSSASSGAITSRAFASSRPAGSVHPLHWLCLALILAGAFWLRGHDPLYNTAFMDENFNVRYGKMFLANHYEYPFEQPLHWSFGWFLWPMMAAFADRAAGLAGLRVMSALLGTLSVLAVYGLARRAYSPDAGLAAAAILALLSPAIFAFRIATYDSGAIFFLALGLWLYVCAWQDMEIRQWLWASVFFFAAFLCKYVVALYFPLLVLAALRKGARSLLAFSLPLGLLCAGYGWYYRADLLGLLSFYSGFNRRNVMSGAQLWNIYVVQRLDLWVLGTISFAAWPWVEDRTSEVGRVSDRDTLRWTFVLLWMGAAVMLIFQSLSKLADMRFYKHATYTLIFLCPLAAEGILRLARLAGKKLYSVLGTATVVLVAASLGWAGDSWRTESHIFWPNVEPILAFFEGRLTPANRVLLDDQGVRYYLESLLPARNISEAYYFRYGGTDGPAAFAAAVRDGYFDYVALDGSGLEEEVLAMRDAIRPVLPERYVQRMTMHEPALLRTEEVWERVNPPIAGPGASGPHIAILRPADAELVKTSKYQTQLEGHVAETPPESYLRADLFTNRWYPQGDQIYPEQSTGHFSQTIFLGGEGAQQCNHIVRVRLYDSTGKWLATAANFAITRANPDGSRPACP